ncbi:hypothetical protein Tco_1077986 [Tanacetum coccineum]
MMGWSEMLPEVLDIIALKYIICYEDYPSFAGVCKSWRLAAARTYPNSNGPPSRFPSLMLAEKRDDQESRELFLLSNKSIRKIQVPQAYDKACKSSCGWLVTVGGDFATQLINPLSGEIINLPKAKTSWRSVDPSNWDTNILKDLDDQHVEDLDNQHVNLACYIVGLDDGERKQLLVIIKKFNEKGCPETYKTKSFKVLAYDLKSGDWSKVKDFGRKTLFVGFSSSF